MWNVLPWSRPLEVCFGLVRVEERLDRRELRPPRPDRLERCRTNSISSIPTVAQISHHPIRLSLTFRDSPYRVRVDGRLRLTVVMLRLRELEPRLPERLHTLVEQAGQPPCLRSQFCERQVHWSAASHPPVGRSYRASI
jgi:hypothetical protein